MSGVSVGVEIGDVIAYDDAGNIVLPVGHVEETRAVAVEFIVENIVPEVSSVEETAAPAPDPMADKIADMVAVAVAAAMADQGSSGPSSFDTYRSAARAAMD